MKVIVELRNLKDEHVYSLEMAGTLLDKTVGLKIFKDDDLLAYTTESIDDFCKAVELVTGRRFREDDYHSY